MEEADSSLSFWHGIAIGGPFIVALHWLMLVSFALTLVLSFRRAGSIIVFALSAAQFAFGAVAMWLGVAGVAAVISGVTHDGGNIERLQLAQRPFFIGAGFSLVAFIIYFLARARTRHTRIVRINSASR